MFSRLSLSALVLTTGLNSVVGDSAAEAEAYNAARAAANPSCSSVDTAAATHQADCPSSTTWQDRAGSDAGSDADSDSAGGQGCMDPHALNYDPLATEDDGTQCQFAIQRALTDVEIQNMPVGAVLFKPSGTSTGNSIPRWYRITNKITSGTLDIYGALVTVTPEDPYFEITYCPGVECYQSGKTGWAHDVWPDSQWGYGDDPYVHNEDCDTETEGLSAYGTIAGSVLKDMYEQAQASFFTPLGPEIRHYFADPVKECPDPV